MRSTIAALTLLAISVTAVHVTQAGEPLRHSGQAIHHSAAAVAEFLSAGFKLAAVAVSVPVKVLESAGDEAARAAAMNRDAAQASAAAGKVSALPLTDEVLTAHRRPGDALRILEE